MTSTRSQFNYETCKASGKIKYPTKQKAYKAAQALQGPNGRALMTVYKCDKCKAYHLSHKNKAI